MKLDCHIFKLFTLFAEVFDVSQIRFASSNQQNRKILILKISRAFTISDISSVKSSNFALSIFECYISHKVKDIWFIIYWYKCRKFPNNERFSDSDAED